ncbi:MacB family efflux pump subunit [Psychrobacter cryohalolentis]|uniref:Macrolide export ATP-binding/permease protein MacB n=1 Tax=Psychrobacter cryohalolentis (strain ATCC BAA-1226 / DSM 17306 / VKM B-2378 / K5) TaxID=335284 RepID=MACB_PSYCK|nr:MacB family efflux pump subunit [Psychrobacter cryohalolentis]Q1QDA8.1 RecName: Full=Macrolide export ATP-binding/permease protein MacB [Psychrobacter cryohalolentis K5]ABE74345.1 ABC transporter related protein [Psychrobacter cryohalolentis K5]ASE26976.1 macrolide ABC transporter permease/ATP-binding protein MacB [Psychrobacter cryohalolentis]
MSSQDLYANAATDKPLMQVKGLIREFKAGEQTIRVLHDINLTIHQGEMVAIIGQSGSGKSTLMNILGCLDQATAGDYQVFGQSVNRLVPDELAKLRREHFGFIFQRYHLLGDISARDNVSVPAVYAGMDGQARNERAEKLLSDLGLADKVNNRPSQLSGGQQQRVSIARALMNGGDIILADEPTGALDSKSGKDVVQILKDLNAQGHTIIMVTHDPSLAAQAERVIEIKDGYIIADYKNEDYQRPAAQPASIIDKHRKSAFGSFIDRLLESFKMSLLAMRAHKMRTLLTMLGIIIGIASVVSVVGLGKGSQEQILSNISSLGTNTITVTDGYPYGDPRRQYNDDNLTPQDAQAVADQPYVLSVSPQLNSNMSVRYRNVQEAASISGVGKDYLDVSGETLAMGQGFDEQSILRRTQDIIIDSNAHKTFFPTIANPIGEVLLIGSVPGRVIGVLEPNEGGFSRSVDTPTLYMPYTTMMSRLIGSAYIESFIALIDNNISSSAAESAISDLMTSRHGTDDFRIRNSDSIRQTIESTTAALTLLISSIAIISLIVGGIGVMNIMLVSVTERTNEIGVRMAVGARQSDIMQQFLIEAILVCILGGLLGIGLAFAIGELINRVGGDSFKVIYSSTSIIAAFVCSTLIGVVFGFLPARNAAKLDPVEALSRD